jgi:mono/diheme cytochrome c family protein
MVQLRADEPEGRHSRSKRQLIAWALAALGASALLVGVLRWEHLDRYRRGNTLLVGMPRTGAKLFERKGCIRCHAVNGAGGRLAPDLGSERPSTGPDHLVTSMWNHAPRMWERIREERVAYPAISQQEMAHVFSYLYTSRYVGDSGDVEQGGRLFEKKGCVACHSLGGTAAKKGPDLSTRAAVDSLTGWTQAMWNHAPAMESAMREAGVTWPKFEPGEMNDLLAYLRGGRPVASGGSDLLPADPDRGKKLFEEKSCASCHSLRGEVGRIGPELQSRQKLPPTIIQFAGSMWNHSPEMLRTMRARGVQRPVFRDREMADLVAFLYSLSYSEPGGSPRVGEMLFAGRGCSLCHGPAALGTSEAPSLRGRGKSFNSIALAAALWRHGPGMYKHAQDLGLPWPTLAETDVGDLISFLNTSPERDR